MSTKHSRLGQQLAIAGLLLAAAVIGALLAPVMHPTDVAPAPAHSHTARPTEATP
ncbi:hypothetical protein [Curtobacterium flaccumfaciens]|uniref:hypothetical protein n=1 Tax=Curtobacterium flaccumfaciens TaxID=2035 RepID=UPI001601F93E|nr:hypothetical protein [Curtobacterium flaccumfaciens]